MYKFVTLDPRSVPAAIEANDAVFSSGSVYGIEVTVPALASCCVSNLDPQHSGGDPNQAAIEVALTSELPPDGSTLATVRADLDSVGAMAVLGLRANGHVFGLDEIGTLAVEDNREMALHRMAILTRINTVAEADRFERGGYTGPKPFPTSDNPWPTGSYAESTRELAAIAAAVSDFKIPLETRVTTMEQWLLTGEEPQQYRTQVDIERADLIAAIEAGQIWAKLISGVAVVQTTHRAATMVGYCLAPVVVALNPNFRFQRGEPHAKFTVCQYTTGHCDLKATLADLQKLESGWSGSLTIIGSPQGVGSTLTLEQVTQVVSNHLKS